MKLTTLILTITVNIPCARFAATNAASIVDEVINSSSPPPFNPALDSPYSDPTYINSQISLASSSYHNEEHYLLAEQIYNEILQYTSNNNIDALHLKGILNYQFREDVPLAIQLLTEAIALSDHPRQRLKPVDYKLQLMIYTNLGEIYRSSGNPSLAIATNQEAIDIARRAGGHYDLLFGLLYNQAQGHLDLNEKSKALGKLEIGLQMGTTDGRNENLPPNFFFKTYLDIAQIKFSFGEYLDALDFFQHAKKINDSDVEVLMGIGTCLQKMGLLDDAFGQYVKVLEIDPRHPNAKLNTGAIYHERGEIERAIEIYKSCLASLNIHEPTYERSKVMIMNNLGAAYISGGQVDSGVAILEQIMEINPDIPDVLVNLGSFYNEEGSIEKGNEHLQRAIVLLGGVGSGNGNYNDNNGQQGVLSGVSAGLMIRQRIALPPIQLDLPTTTATRLNFENGVAELAYELISKLPNSNKIIDPVNAVERIHFYLVYHCIGNDRQTQLLVNQMYSHAFLVGAGVGAGVGVGAGAGAGQPLHLARKKEKHEKIRIGFVSKFFGDFEPHGLLLEGIIRYLPRELFITILFSISASGGGPAPYLVSAADEVVLLDLNYNSARFSLMAAELDVLIFADMNSEPMNHFLGYNRIAKIQALFWGNPITSGNENIDFFISADRMENPFLTKNSNRHSPYSEQLVLLDGQGIWYSEPNGLISSSYSVEMQNKIMQSSTKLTLADFGILNHLPGTTLYLCAQSLFKLHPLFDDVVFDILRKHEKSVIVFTKGRRPAWTEKLIDRMKKNPKFTEQLFSRIIFIDRVNSLDFPSLIQLADVMLHPFPFGGSRTSVDGLQHGIPVVTFPQKSLRGRMAVSFYASMGIWDCCVANSVEQYVDKATKLGQNEQLREDARRLILERVGRVWDDMEVVYEWTRWLLRVSGKDSFPSPSPSRDEFNSNVMLKMQRDEEVVDFGIVPTPTVDDDYTPYELFLARTASAYNAAGELESSKRQLRLLMFERPLDVGVLNDLGAVLEQLWELNAAEIVLREAIVINPDFKTARNNLGVVLKDLGRMDEALEMLSGGDLEIANAANVLRDSDKIEEAYTLVCEFLFSKGECGEGTGNGNGNENILKITAIALLEHSPRLTAAVGEDLMARVSKLREGGGGGGHQDQQQHQDQDQNRLGLINSLATFMHWTGRWDGAAVTRMYKEIGFVDDDGSYDRCEEAGRVKINLITSYFSFESEARRIESKIALTANTMNACVDRVVVFLERPLLSGEQIVDMAVDMADKITLINLGRRPTFADAFEFANDHIRNDEVVVLSNDDIAFDHTLKVLENGVPDKTIFALTRHEHDVDFGSTGGVLQAAMRLNQEGGSFVLHPRIDSQDVWVWSGEIDHTVVDQARFFQGLPRCDNRLAALLRENDYTVLNPSVGIVAKHCENMIVGSRGVKNNAVEYGYKVKDGVRGKGEFVLISLDYLF